MAPQTRQRRLVLVILVAVMAIPAGAKDDVDVATTGHLVYDCDPDPRWLSTANGTAFYASLPPLLAALPSAAAPTGYASLRSGNGLAFVHGLCYGESPAPHDCHECLSISVQKVDICGRHAGYWSAGCFLAYADTTASSSIQEDEWALLNFAYMSYHPDFYDVERVLDLAWSLAPRAANGSSSGGRMLATANALTLTKTMVRALAQCPGYLTGAGCARCLEKSAGDLSDSLRALGREHERVQFAGAISVLRYNCYLRLEISATLEMPPAAMGKGARLRKKMKDHLAVVVVVAVAIVVLIAGAAFLVLRRTRSRNRKAQAARHVDS